MDIGNADFRVAPLFYIDTKKLQMGIDIFLISRYKKHKAVLSLLAKELPQEKYTRLLSFVTNGVSKDEMSTVIQVLRQHLSEGNKQQIKR